MPDTAPTLPPSPLHQVGSQENTNFETVVAKTSPPPLFKAAGQLSAVVFPLARAPSPGHLSNACSPRALSADRSVTSQLPLVVASVSIPVEDRSATLGVSIAAEPGAPRTVDPKRQFSQGSLQIRVPAPNNYQFQQMQKGTGPSPRQMLAQPVQRSNSPQHLVSSPDAARHTSPLQGSRDGPARSKSPQPQPPDNITEGRGRTTTPKVCTQTLTAEPVSRLRSPKVTDDTIPPAMQVKAFPSSGSSKGSITASPAIPHISGVQAPLLSHVSSSVQLAPRGSASPTMANRAFSAVQAAQRSPASPNPAIMQMSKRASSPAAPGNVRSRGGQTPAQHSFAAIQGYHSLR